MQPTATKDSESQSKDGLESFKADVARFKAGISSSGFKPVADEVEVEIGQVIEGHPNNAAGLPEVVQKALAEAGVPFTSVELRKGKGLVIRVPKGTPFEAVSEVLRKVAPGRAASAVGAAA